MHIGKIALNVNVTNLRIIIKKKLSLTSIALHSTLKHNFGGGAGLEIRLLVLSFKETTNYRAKPVLNKFLLKYTK